MAESFKAYIRDLPNVTKLQIIILTTVNITLLPVDILVAGRLGNGRLELAVGVLLGICHGNSLLLAKVAETYYKTREED